MKAASFFKLIGATFFTLLACGASFDAGEAIGRMLFDFTH